MNDTTQLQQNDNTQAQASVSNDVEYINGVACPIDPFEREMCDSCQ